jgi:hypothetical protein
MTNNHDIDAIGRVNSRRDEISSGMLKYGNSIESLKQKREMIPWRPVQLFKKCFRSSIS